MSKVLTYSPVKYYLGVFIPLLLCGLICLFFRSSDTYANIIWNDLFSFNLSSSWKLNDIIIYNLPSALWVFSITLISFNIKPSITKKLPFSTTLLPLFFIIILEFFQLFNLTNGTFDILDILLPALAWLFAIFLLSRNKQAIQSMKVSFHHSILFQLVFLLVFLSDTVG